MIYLYNVRVGTPKLGMGIFIAALLAASCETSLDFETFSAPKLTIISQITPGDQDGQVVFVYASKSASDSSKFYTPDHLVVDVTELETQITFRLDTTLDGNKIYFKFPEAFLKAGFSYSITAFAPGFEPVQATTLIPRPSSIVNLSIEDVHIAQSEAHEFKKIIHYRLVFDIDHFESNRYYHLVFLNEYEGLDDAYIVDPELSDNQPFVHHPQYGVLIDRHDLVEGEPLSFEFRDWAVTNHDLRRVSIELRTISAEYYKYQSTLARQLIVRQDPFAEPVTIFNNIEGGFGNFSGFAKNTTSSDLHF